MARVTAFSLILFYVVLNLSFYLVAETQTLGTGASPALTSPTDMVTKLVGSLFTFVIGTILTAAFKNWLFGAAAMSIWAVQFLIGNNSIIYWIFYGTPAFINSFASQYGLASAQLTVFTNVVLGLTALPWFWFIMNILTSRGVEEV
jgi:hypothetical protein